MQNMAKYFALVQGKIDLEQDASDTAILVRALDRFHRRLQAMNTLCEETDFATCVTRRTRPSASRTRFLFSSTGTEIVINAGRKQCKAHLRALKIHFADSLTKVRQSLATPRSHQDEAATNLTEMLTSLILSAVEKIKGILQDLLVITTAVPPRP